MSSDESDDVQIFIDDRNVDPSVPSCSGYKPNKSKSASKKKDHQTLPTRSSKRKKEKPSESLKPAESSKPSESSPGPRQKFLNSPRNFVPQGVRIKDYLKIDPMTWNVLKNLKYAKSKVGGRGDKAIKIYSDDEMENGKNDQTGAVTPSRPNEDEMFAKCDEIIMSYLPDDDEDDDDESCKRWLKDKKRKKTKCPEGPLTDEALVFHYTSSSLLDSDDNELKDSDEDTPSESKSRVKHRKKINYKKIHQKKTDMKKRMKENCNPATQNSSQKESILLSLLSPDSTRRPRWDPSCPNSRFISDDTGSSGTSSEIYENPDKDLASYQKILGNRIPRVTLSRISIKGNSLNVSKENKSSSNYTHCKDSQKNKKKGKLGKPLRRRKVDLLPHEEVIDNRVLRVSIRKPVDKSLHNNLK